MSGLHPQGSLGCLPPLPCVAATHLPGSASNPPLQSALECSYKGGISRLVKFVWETSSFKLAAKFPMQIQGLLQNLPHTSGRYCGLRWGLIHSLLQVPREGGPYRALFACAPLFQL